MMLADSGRRGQTIPAACWFAEAGRTCRTQGFANPQSAIRVRDRLVPLGSRPYFLERTV
jgi:hypothetical protein